MPHDPALPHGAADSRRSTGGRNCAKSPNALGQMLHLLVLGGLFLMGCPEPDPGDNPGGSLPCDEDTRAEQYLPGMEKQGAAELLTLVLRSAQPAPPDVGDNLWFLEIRDSSNDAPAEGCEVSAQLFMPDHGHGAEAPLTTPGAAAGEYELSSLGFIMAGFWTVTIDMDCPGIGGDSVVFAFCLDG